MLCNPGGREPGSRNRLSDEVISSFLRDWRKHGDKALERVRRTRPEVYCKLAVLLVPKEHKVEHSSVIQGLSDEQLEVMIADGLAKVLQWPRRKLQAARRRAIEAGFVVRVAKPHSGRAGLYRFGLTLKGGRERARGGGVG